MVTYLPTTASRAITVLTAEVGTTLTITAPASVIQGQPFIIEGVLKRADTLTPLLGEEISLSYNGFNLGTTQTRSLEGSIKYQAIVQIDEVGAYTLRADFAGAIRVGLTLGASSATRGIGLAVPGILPLVALAAAAYLLLKK